MMPMESCHTCQSSHACSEQLAVGAETHVEDHVFVRFRDPRLPVSTRGRRQRMALNIDLAPTMLAFYELGGRTPTPLAVLAQTVGWVSVITWAVIHALMFADVVTFDYSAPATGAMALEQVALIVIGLWIAGANLLAGEWLSWIRWLGVVTGIGFALLGAGLLLGGESHPLSYLGGTAYELVLPIWAFWLARLFGRIAGLR